MPSNKDNKLFGLLRLALGTSQGVSFALSKQEWVSLYEQASRQLLLGLFYNAICKLSSEQRPPISLAFQWASEAETIRGQNALLNGVAARLTERFDSVNRKSAVLKGPANARLYPDAFARQCGDIDIWVEGGREKVVDLLLQLGLLEPEKKQKGMSREAVIAEEKKKFSQMSPHHVHLQEKMDGVSVEVHFRPSSGNLNPFSNGRMQKFLEKEIGKTERVAEGFNVPSIRFALVMQLSHIQRHFVASGIGLKQVVDYAVLLQRSTAEDRSFVSANLKRFGLHRTAAALMWIFENLLGLNRECLLCAPDKRRAELLLAEIFRGGAFGHYIPKVSTSFVRRFMHNWFHPLRHFTFDPAESLWGVLKHVEFFASTIPMRIRVRKFSLKEFS